MKLVNVKIVTHDALLTELVVNGVHLEKAVRSYKLVHEAGGVPVLQLELYVDDLDLVNQGADCEADG